MDQMWLLIILSFVVICILCLILLQLTLADAYPEVKEFKSESYYLEQASGERKPFSSFMDAPTCNLTVVVPAYNEEQRLPPMLEEAIEYLESRHQKDSFSYEIIIVDDGSSDLTSKVGLEYTEKFGSDKIKVLTLAKNRGKGGAVRLGMMRGRGEMMLFADADGATKFSDFSKVEASLKKICQGKSVVADSLGIVCGSRSHLEEESVATRSFLRTLLMYGFHFVVWSFTVKGIKDTQCGFKLLTRKAAQNVFKSLHIERWAFDVEMLFIAQKIGIPINEVAVTWTEIDGSKVTPIISWIQMGKDIILIWLRYTLGIWKIKDSCKR